MAILLVTYDLKKPGQDYSGVLSYLKKFSWARLSESTYAIETNLSPLDVYSQVRQFIDVNDFVYVITLTKPYMGFNLQAVNDWLQARLL